MWRRHKFRPGRKVTGREAVDLILAGRWLYWHEKPQHPKVLINLPLAVLVKCDILRIAEPNEEPKK